jgi:hypothetical protein
MMVVPSTLNGGLMRVNGICPRDFLLFNANCFVPVCSIVTSKTIINVHWEGREGSGDGRQQ